MIISFATWVGFVFSNASCVCKSKRIKRQARQSDLKQEKARTKKKGAFGVGINEGREDEVCISERSASIGTQAGIVRTRESEDHAWLVMLIEGNSGMTRQGCMSPLVSKRAEKRELWECDSLAMGDWSIASSKGTSGKG